MKDFSSCWIEALNDVILNGGEVAPRGRLTKEILHRTMQINMRKPVLTVPDRHLNYRFMAAEAYWILSGDSQVESIAKYNPRIADFSDDGLTFFGAYGPKITAQFNYVVTKLLEDNNTRQAGLTLWRENPPDTKDVPCTIAMFFSLRWRRLNAHVFMRSNDLWLGTPYDVFNFSMLSHLICAYLNKHDLQTEPGELFLTAASSHLYSDNWNGARLCIMENFLGQYETPTILFTDPSETMGWLKDLRETKPGDELRWWEVR